MMRKMIALVLVFACVFAVAMTQASAATTREEQMKKTLELLLMRNKGDFRAGGNTTPQETPEIFENFAPKGMGYSVLGTYEDVRVATFDVNELKDAGIDVEFDFK